MPNPLFMRQRSTSQDADRPLSIEPVPEKVHGTVFAYRGMETHGVDPSNDWRDPEKYDGYERGIEVDFESEEPAQEPTLVRVVNEDMYEIGMFRTFRASATGTAKGTTASQVIGAQLQDNRRRKVRVKNLDSTTVYIGHDGASASPMHGWPLAQNEVFETLSQKEIYAVGSVATESPLAVHVEYVVVYG